MKTTNQYNFDLELVKLLAKGMTQKEVSEHLKEKGITPNSVSIIEKRLKAIRIDMKAKTTIHLFVKLAKKGII